MGNQREDESLSREMFTYSTRPNSTPHLPINPIILITNQYAHLTVE